MKNQIDQLDVISERLASVERSIKMLRAVVMKSTLGSRNEMREWIDRASDNTDQISQLIVVEADSIGDDG